MAASITTIARIDRLHPRKPTAQGDDSVIITENQLDEWVRGNAKDAQGVIVELV